MGPFESAKRPSWYVNCDAVSFGAGRCRYHDNSYRRRSLRTDDGPRLPGGEELVVRRGAGSEFCAAHRNEFKMIQAHPESIIGLTAIIGLTGRNRPHTGDRRPLSVGLVATCPPRQCGIATFSTDLSWALKQAEPGTDVHWAAINEPDSDHVYEAEVRWCIRQNDAASYCDAARQLNISNVDVVAVQHEFGLYGIWGKQFEDHLALFMETLRKPLVTTLHTVLPDPSPSVREAVRRIGLYSHAVVVMAKLAKRMLADDYGLPEDKVHVIPHGVPPVEPHGRHRTKARFGWQDRTILSTFGLLDPRKGLEYMIEAMGPISREHSDALYVIVGNTHPELLRQAGEAYRQELNELVQARGLGAHVTFVNNYLTQAQIVEYLLASDVYVTPYLDPKQITSGTLAYALGAGKAIVSTPYLHATEVLADGRGILVPFRDADALAASSVRILGDIEYKRKLEVAAYNYGRETAWPNVGRRMLDLFRTAGSAEAPEAVAHSRWTAERQLMLTSEDGAPTTIPFNAPIAPVLTSVAHAASGAVS